MKAKTLEDRVRGAVLAGGFRPSAGPLLVAVSGGVDSMVLLRALHAAGLPVSVAHLDHGARAESGEDAAFVALCCEERGIPFTIAQWQDWEAASDKADSFEMAARKRRYAFLTATAQRLGLSHVATAHHLDDQAETVVLRLLRGAGTGGLAGIRPTRPLNENVTLLRPLLGVSRAEIRAYVEAHQVAWREDRSNTDLRYGRNRVRHVVLPQLIELMDAQLPERLAQTAEILREDDALLAELARDATREVLSDDRLLRAPFVALHPALQRRVLLGWFGAYGVAADHALVLEAVARIGGGPVGGLSLNATHRLHIAQDAVVMLDDASSVGASTISTLSVPGHCDFLGRRFETRWVEASPHEACAACTPTRQVFDADRLGPALHVRTRRPGDRFQPLGQSRPQKLQDYLVNRHIPRPDRDRLPLLLSGDEIAWVVGHAPAASFAITPATRRALLVEVTPCV